MWKDFAIGKSEINHLDGGNMHPVTRPMHQPVVSAAQQNQVLHGCP
jgi:hypothetical protein